jgi:hypothetical protein
MLLKNVFMKKLFMIMLLFVPVLAFCQEETGKKKEKNNANDMKTRIGIKVGFNFANVTNASSINSSSQTGFMAGAFIAPPAPGILAYRTEVIFSRQGYDFKAGTNTGTVNLNYIMLPQMMGINITKFVQLQVGAQMAFLLNAKVDSAKSQSTQANPYSQVMDYYNRIDYGAAAGIEIYPFKGVIVGGRYNISFGNLYKDLENPTPGTMPSFIPKVDAKNNVVQLFIGYKF